ncbi:SapB/AmfS family lanthipeptide [Micromonospora okii]|nr:SapB/AmfS family lanthipeptide [Micromonospora okii]
MALLDLQGLEVARTDFPGPASNASVVLCPISVMSLITC